MSRSAARLTRMSSWNSRPSACIASITPKSGRSLSIHRPRLICCRRPSTLSLSMRRPNVSSRFPMPHSILFYSTGRCGSTLVSHVLNQIPTVVSFSEPDVFTQLVQLRTAGQSNAAEVTALLYASLMIMAANARQRGFQYWAFKFRSYVLSVSDLLYQAVPAAKLLFLYRNALTWARSFSRAFGSADAELEDRLVKDGFRYLSPRGDIYSRTHTQTITWLEYLAHMWVSTMQDSRWLQQQDAAL